MLAEVAILRDVLVRALEILAGDEQPNDAAPTKNPGSTGEAP
jgi:hypothetical protein